MRGSLAPMAEATAANKTSRLAITGSANLRSPATDLGPVANKQVSFESRVVLPGAWQLLFFESFANSTF